jgi:hypothetical protein
MIQDFTFYTERYQYQMNTADLRDGGALFLTWSMENKKKALFEKSLTIFQSKNYDAQYARTMRHTPTNLR